MNAFPMSPVPVMTITARTMEEMVANIPRVKRSAKLSFLLVLIRSFRSVLRGMYMTRLDVAGAETYPRGRW